MAPTVEDDVFVDLVGDQEDLGVAQYVGQLAQIFFPSIAPDGLCGLLIINMRVRGVMASCTFRQSTAKVCGSRATCTALAPARSIAGS